MDRRSFIERSGRTAAALAIGARPAIAADMEAERSPDFTVTVDGKPVFVHRAAASYSFVTVDIDGPAVVEVTAADTEFWRGGAEVLPSRHGIRPERSGGTIRFRIDGPGQQLAISRPGDYFSGARMLFLFANRPDDDVPVPDAPGVRYFGPGVHREDIHVASNETVYLAPGAIVHGSLNFWGVEHAKVCGRGVVIHDGPQNPADDEGWQHRPDWHGITLHDARDIEIRGITVLVRSRTWMIQLEGCRDVLFDNVKAIGGTKGNANQDGIDWLGCGDTIVRNCFFRCSDDIFAIYGNTGFYDQAAAIPGKDVRNILIERCVLSTSISNVMRVGWPHKIFNSSNVTLRDSDIVHMGLGSCVVPFALAEFWADPAGRGTHEHYLFEDLRLDSWYSLAQLRQPPLAAAKVRNIRFRNIRSVERPPLVPAASSGDVGGIVFENVTFGDRRIADAADLGLPRTAATVVPGALTADFSYPAGRIAPGRSVRFDARTSRTDGRIVDYLWTFGDGRTARGPVVIHAFSDTLGTLLDGSGRFRVQLTVVDDRGRRDAIARPVVVCATLAPPVRSAAVRPENAAYTTSLDGVVDVPADGGYTFTLLARDGAQLALDGRVLVEDRTVEPQVCGTAGNRMRSMSASIGLARGPHRLSIAFDQGPGADDPTLYWQGPGVRLQPVPTGRLRRVRPG